MATYNFTVYDFVSLGSSDAVTPPFATKIIAGAGKLMSVIDDDSVLDDQENVGGSTLDVSSQVLGAAFEGSIVGRIVTTAAILHVINYTTGEVGKGHIIHILNGSDPANPPPNLNASIEQRLMAFTIAISPGDEVTFGFAAPVGQVPYASLLLTNVPPVLNAVAPATIAESQSDPDKGVLITTLSASDPNGDAVTFLFANGTATSGDFKIVGSEVRYFGPAFDFEAAPPAVSLSVIAKDASGAASPAQTFSVSVTDLPNFFFTNGHDGSQGSPIDLKDLAGQFDAESLYNALSGNDWIILPDAGNPGWDFGKAFDGGTGNDRIQGGSGNDILFGNSGVDWLFGGGGDDQLNGGTGNDLISGGLGKDVLTGGSGYDTFIFRSAANIGNGNGTSDLITDFQQGYDKIDLSAVQFLGPVKFKLVSSAAQVGADFDTVYIYTEGGKTIIAGSNDIFLGIDFRLELSGASKLKGSESMIAKSFILNENAWNDNFGGVASAPNYAALHSELLLV